MDKFRVIDLFAGCGGLSLGLYLAGNWMYAWWKSDRKHNYWRIYGGDADVYGIFPYQ